MLDQDLWRRLLVAALASTDSPPHRIARLCVRMLGVSGAGISVVTTAGNRGVVCATDAGSSRIEELQFSLGEGPCTEAAASGSPVLLPDIALDSFAASQWPAFMDAWHPHEAGAVFAFPMRIGAIQLGALTLYRNEAGDLRSDELTGALVAADAAALALLEDGDHRSAEDGFADDLDIRSTYRLQVHQATGMVKVQLDGTLEEALLMLRARAFSAGRSLSDIADDVVARRLRFEPVDR